MIELVQPFLLAWLGYDFVSWWGNLLLAIWLWSLGANVGSFMNVVVHRVPLGLSVVYPGSRCPNCREPIRWHDNIPIFSWLWLRARCRFCGTPISARYPLVETLMAVLFLVIGFLSPVALERTVLRVPSHQLGMILPWLMYGYQMVLLSTLVCVALIRWDGQRARWPIWVSAFAVGGIMPLLPPFGLWSVVRPWASVSGVPVSPWLLGWLDSFTGLSVSFLLLILVHAANRRAGGQRKLKYASTEFLLCGLMLGWQLVTSVVFLATGLQLAQAVLAKRQVNWARVPFTALLTCAVVILLITWPLLETYSAAVAHQMNMLAWSLMVLSSLVFVYLTARIMPRVPPRPAHDFTAVAVPPPPAVDQSEQLMTDDWDPFVDEPEQDQPFLYIASQPVGGERWDERRQPAEQTVPTGTGETLAQPPSQDHASDSYPPAVDQSADTTRSETSDPLSAIQPSHKMTNESS